MNIQHSTYRQTNPNNHQASQYRLPYLVEEDLIEQLTSFINSLFAPLTWILEETLYKRVHKEDKAWISIDFLHRNTTFQAIFKRYDIKSHSRMKKNIIDKAIQKSQIKRKRNLIKRKRHLRISSELKKVLYLELNSTQNIAKNMMNEQTLRQIIGQSLNDIINARKEQQNPNRMEIEGEDKTHLDFQSIMSSIVFQGSLFNENQKNSPNQMHEDNQNQKTQQTNVSYRWCFIYFPFLEEHQVQKILIDFSNVITNLQKTITKNTTPQKILFENEMNNLNLTSESIDRPQNSVHQNHINIYPLQTMISKYHPIYNEVCEQMGYSHVDYRKQVLRVREKQREKERVRLLESRYLDDKIDLVHEYHLKLQIQREKRAYWERRNKLIEEKARKRQERRKNRNNKNYQIEQKKDLTSKFKQLFNIDQPPKPKVQEKSFEASSEFSKEKIGQAKKIQQIEIKEDSISSSSVTPVGPGFKIKIPQYNLSESHGSEIYQSSQQKFQTSQKGLKSPEINMDGLYESSSNEDYYDDMNSSGEQFELPRKRNRNRNKQNDSQTKNSNQISKFQENNFSKPKPENGKTSASKSSKNTQNNHATRNGGHLPSLRNVSNTNASYNLRHKSPSQGSYLKMAGFGYDDGQDYRKKEKNQIYEDDQDEKYEQSSSRNMRPRRS